MWFIAMREAAPDVPYWSGRRWLAACDAVLWPILWVAVIRHAPWSTGIVGRFIVVAAALCAAGRVHRALWVNHRYRFTTWRWGRVAALLLLVGAGLKLAMNV